MFDDPRITAMGLFAEAFLGLSGRLAAQLAEHALAPIEFEVLLRLARSPQRHRRHRPLTPRRPPPVVERSPARRSGVAPRQAAGTPAEVDPQQGSKRPHSRKADEPPGYPSRREVSGPVRAKRQVGHQTGG